MAVQLLRKPFALDESEDNVIVTIEKKEDIPYTFWELGLEECGY